MVAMPDMLLGRKGLEVPGSSWKVCGVWRTLRLQVSDARKEGVSPLLGIKTVKPHGVTGETSGECLQNKTLNVSL